MSEVSEAFKGVVAEWLRAEGRDVAAVRSVTTDGTDWAGDTEGGYHSESDVDITYITATGEEKRTTIQGEEMASLWNFVMKSWPA